MRRMKPKKDGEVRIQDVREKAEELDKKLLATDPRLSGSVLVMHMDGSLMLFDRAFALLYKKDWAIILTEHHGSHYYCLDELTHLRGLGPRLHIGNVEEPKLAPLHTNAAPKKAKAPRKDKKVEPKLNKGKIAKRLGAERRGKVPANGGYFGALETAAAVRNIQQS